jgi:DSF synthase
VTTFDLRDLQADLDEIALRYEPESAALTCLFNHTERPCVTTQLLDHIHALQAMLHDGIGVPVKWVVWGSAVPGVYCTGGDLALFVRLIRQRDEAALREYAHICVDAIHANLKAPAHTIALVRGNAYGGGLEMALSCDVIVAERNAKLGFPEILFNTFAGMGAASILSRKVGGGLAHRIMTSGRLYDATELHGLGVVDILAQDGEGETTVQSYVDRNQHRHGALMALRRVRQLVQPISLRELRTVTDVWVETCLRLSDVNLRSMERLARCQQQKYHAKCSASLPTGTDHRVAAVA